MKTVCIKGAGSGDAAPGVAGWLGFAATLAAAPVFALMALGTVAAATPDMLCASMGGSPLGGMTLMYLLMSVVHLAPWLRLFARAFSSEVDTGSREENAPRGSRR
jgi:hypothetical protein